MLIRLCSALLLLLTITASSPAQETGQTGPRRLTTETGSALPDPNPEGAASENSSANNAEQTVPIPARIGGVGPSLAFGSELDRSNYLLLGLSVGTGFDDNALLSNKNAISNYSYSVFPHLAVKQFRTRTQWWLNYEGGVTVNQQVTSLNQGSHDLSFESLYRLSPHVNLRLNEEFYIATGVFDQVSDQSALGGGALQGPNPLVITPLSRRMSNLTTAETDYQFSRTNLIGMSGSFYDLHFSDVPTGGSSLFDTHTQSGNLFLAHQLSPRNSIGTSYMFQRITLGSAVSDTVAHGLVVFDTINLEPSTNNVQPRMTLSMFIGPEYSTTTSALKVNGVGVSAESGVTVLAQHQWSPSGGVTYDWNGDRTSVFVGFFKGISDGGGSLAAVQLQNVNGGLRRQITRRWSAKIAGNYGTNDSLDPFLGLTSIKEASGTVTLEHQVWDKFFLRLGYIRQFQQEFSKGSSVRRGNRNVILLSVSYQLARPWGR